MAPGKTDTKVLIYGEIAKRGGVVFLKGSAGWSPTFVGDEE